jgi:hypothetical protein
MSMSDLRDEKMTRLGSTLARIGPTPQVPSPNLKKIMDAIESGELEPIFKLAIKIDDGEATGDEAESLTVYEAVPLLVGYISDLTGMCRRREEALAELDIQIGRP